MPEPKVNAETEIGKSKTRKPRVVKPKPTNYDQALAIAQGLNLEDKAALVKELKRQLTSEGDTLLAQAKAAAQILEGI